MSEEFGLKVCGRFYNSFISKCAANKWCEISETVYCNGGDRNYIVLIFDTVSTKGQVVKMHSVTLNGLVGEVIPGSSNAEYMCKKNPIFPLTDRVGQLSENKETVIVPMMKTVLTW